MAERPELGQAVLVGDRPGGQERAGHVVGDGHDHARRRRAVPSAVRDREAGRRSPVRRGSTACDPAPRRTSTPARLEGGAGPLAVELPERAPGSSRCRPPRRR